MPANAQFSLNVRTESTVVAGLDDRTRAWLSSLPAEIRKETMALLQEAMHMPLIDGSVESYLDRVDQIISDRLNQLTCIAPGAAKGMAEVIISSVTGRPPTPIADVDKNWTSFGGRFDASVTAHDVAIAYEEFLGDAGITACQVAHSKEGRERIDRIRSMARTKMARLERPGRTMHHPGKLRATTPV